MDEFLFRSSVKLRPKPTDGSFDDLGIQMKIPAISNSEEPNNRGKFERGRVIQ
jgi:hypothetical protein